MVRKDAAKAQQPAEQALVFQFFKPGNGRILSVSSVIRPAQSRLDESAQSPKCPDLPKTVAPILR